MSPATKRTVVITGGGTGIGAATAELFAEAGHDVTITGRREEVLAAAAKRLGVAHLAFDAADPAAVQAALDQLPTGIDVLVNNAGGNTDRRRPPVAAGDLAGLADGWRANFEANVLTTVLVTEALKPRLADGARIVTVGSVAAKQGSGSYGAAKAALEAWNVETARTLGVRGITANIVAPGVTLDTEFFAGTVSEEWVAGRVATAFNRRAGTPAEIAQAIFFLGRADAGHLTGQVIHVNGGVHTAR
ncbi:SDR family NAD(P)-dependent oxidoreductase [Kutzneria buriramensis]|uniref:3-oxoacyl-[acyl-carrier protein] reductase n=1 Tax=Kutzneria buriramensis TaxID=1045776 RepID=A0A3E0GUC3_9PSEU|nr:SDR family oxidoreductase [Kutzneria buriramensis]REH27668.1 3-oxoacyl-[acyl-carrier protein] reductase [Kutzneria buriramensis]